MKIGDRVISEEGMPKPYFADARVGDTVYSMTYGEGKINSINLKDYYSLLCEFQNGYCIYFTLEGWPFASVQIQALFYSKPIFDIPPPPKRKVKKVIEGWINLYSHVMGRFELGAIHRTKEEADSARGLGRLGEACFIHHEYEVEE